MQVIVNMRRRLVVYNTNPIIEGLFCISSPIHKETIFSQAPRRWTSICCSQTHFPLSGKCAKGMAQFSPSQTLQSVGGRKEFLPKGPERSVCLYSMVMTEASPERFLGETSYWNLMNGTENFLLQYYLFICLVISLYI